MDVGFVLRTSVHKLGHLCTPGRVYVACITHKSHKQFILTRITRTAYPLHDAKLTLRLKIYRSIHWRHIHITTSVFLPLDICWFFCIGFVITSCTVLLRMECTKATEHGRKSSDLGNPWLIPTCGSWEVQISSRFWGRFWEMERCFNQKSLKICVKIGSENTLCDFLNAESISDDSTQRYSVRTWFTTLMRLVAGSLSNMVSQFGLQRRRYVIASTKKEEFKTSV